MKIVEQQKILLLFKYSDHLSSVIFCGKLCEYLEDNLARLIGYNRRLWR